MKGERCKAQGARQREIPHPKEPVRLYWTLDQSASNAVGAPIRRTRRTSAINMVWLLTCIALLALPGTALPQERGKAPSPVLEEVVVTATKTEEMRKDVPNSLILIGSEEIAESPARDIGGLLSNEPGVDFRTYGNYGGAAQEFQIRGMSGNATQVLVNGIKINSPSLGTADMGKVSLNSIERIEVVKGSGSLLYGSGAMGGTVSILTKSPKKDRTDLKLTLGAGTQDSPEFSMEQGMFLTDNWGYFFSANARSTDGFRDNSYLNHKDASLKVLYDRGDAFLLTLYGDYYDREYGLPGLKPPAGTQDYYVGQTRFYNQEAASLLDQGSDKDAHAALEIKTNPLQWLGITFRTDLADMVNYTYSRYAFSGGGDRSWVTNQVHGAEGYAEVTPLEGASLLAGADYRHFGWDRRGVSMDASGTDLPATGSVTTATLHTQGTYVEAQYRPIQYLKGLAGVRREEHSKFGRETLPRWGLVLNPGESTALKVSHGGHFLAPTPNDLFWPADPFTKGNPNLRPETGWHTDFTLEQRLFQDKAFLTLTYFDWDVDNKIRWAPDATGVWTPQNLDRYVGRGWEAGARIGPLQDFTFSLNYTFTRADETNPSVTRYAEYTPQSLFKGTVTYLTGWGLTASAGLNYVGDRIYYGSNRGTATPVRILGSYWTTDLRLEQRLHKNWVLSFVGSDLLDRDYDTYLGSFTDQNTFETSITAYPGAGRAMFLALSYVL